VLDAALIGAAQRAEHYEMAGYGVVRTFAPILGEEDAHDLLQETLDEEGAADEKLTGIAGQIVNPDAESEGASKSKAKMAKGRGRRQAQFRARKLSPPRSA
jgi:ferritin-like metal-binding protein YciE